jgi:phosphatidate cytidylyltransferase
MLRTRIITALVLTPLAIALILLAAWELFLAVSALLFLQGAWEWSAFLGLGDARLRAVYVLVTAGAMTLTGALWLYWRMPEGVIWVGAAWWVVAGIAIATSRLSTAPMMAAVGGLLTLIPAWLAMNLLLVHGPARWMLVLPLFLVWGADVGAYFFGKLLGSHKLAPKLSPRKTWEGAIGGVLTALIVAAVAAWLLQRDIRSLLPLAAVTAVISIQGDLLVSAFKRRVDMKDSGTLFPGHGGVLDRFDSITSALPVFLLGLWLTGA